MAKNQLALKRYRVILKKLSRPGKHSSKEIHQSCINSGIEVAYRTTQKDLEDLRDDKTIFGKELNILEDKRERKWYCTEIPKSIFSSIELEEGEVDALLFYARIINQYSDYPIFKQISVAIKKVFESSNISSSIRDLFELETLLETEKHHSLKGIELITDVLDALHHHKILIIEYQKFDHFEIKTHKIKPIMLKEDKQMWYIVGENSIHFNLMTLALDRIVSLAVSEENFDSIEFDSEDHFKYSFGITVMDEKPTDVVISFNPFQGNYLRTLPIHPTQKILIDNKDEFRIQIRVKPSFEFYSKILSYGELAKIVSPENIAKKIQDSFVKAVSNYK
jgi:predicted DNA-binding transcriptional regulator YafY